MLRDSPINDEFVWTIRSVGIDHVMLGSDYPQFSLADTLAAFNRVNLTEDDAPRRAIRKPLSGWRPSVA